MNTCTNTVVETKGKERLEGLDLLRGVASIVVVIHHLLLHKNILAFRSGYSAVEMFFALSGFVLVYNFGGKIEKGLSFREYIKSRFVRLYPMYLIGLVLGFAVDIYISRKPAFVGAREVTNILAGLLLLPTPATIFEQPGIIFPLNDPSWSLFVELILSVILFYLVRHTTKTVKVIFLFAAIGFSISIIQLGTNTGWCWQNIAGGLFRGVFFFIAGILTFRAQVASRLRRYQREICFSMTILLFAGLIFGAYLGVRGVAYIITIATVIPALVWCTTYKPVGNYSAVSKYLGNASYPLYILHFPVVRVIDHFSLGILHSSIIIILTVPLCHFISHTVEPRFRLGLLRLLS